MGEKPYTPETAPRINQAPRLAARPSEPHTHIGERDA
jgi:hypothetical protein